MTAGAIPAERQHPVGVDFGSSGIKAALIDLDAGEFVGDRQRLETPPLKRRIRWRRSSAI